ncbi:response regulator transcription factor (plasmid) [Streptomyces sp. NBC_01450]|uniref:helix-turn-helix transcriptional regulator n=1 Tax=Streptomyces sp. NBC_01450 TaxID=2903871 RepID=UPI002E2EC09B|nr:response regulator transcription factor [Streptomyces sp. NBC_01450]
MPQPTVVVIADDPIVKEGTDAYLSRVDGLRLSPIDALPTADVLLLLTTRITESTLALLRNAATVNRNRSRRVVLVVNDISERELVRAVELGLTNLLLRPDSTYERIVEAVCHPGDCVLPTSAIRLLAEHVKNVNSCGAQLHGLSHRDIEILKMISDGARTAEIAAALRYSERTIKNVLQAIMKRLSVRNRAHAVSWAVRAGLI